MDVLVVEGGKPLKGTVTISGAKNAALPLICASLLTSQPVVLDNTPRLSDVETLLTLFEVLGASWAWSGPQQLTLSAQNVPNRCAPYELVSKMRASVLVLGPLLARYGDAKVSLPGGCAIGARPIDVLLEGLQALGADINLEGGYVHARVDGRLQGADIVLSKPAVTGTENLMMAAALAQGRTRLIGAAREPEVTALADCLNAMGAKISGAGTDTITIDGVEELGGASVAVMPDRIEAGTFMMAAAMMGEGVMLHNAIPAHNQALMALLKKSGVDFAETADSVFIAPRKPYKPVDVTTLPYPGFPTDLQAQMMVYLCMAQGSSFIRETIYENRFMHVPELNRMGAKLVIDDHTVRIPGHTSFKGATVMATDLRASASLVMAALAAEGVTTIRRVYHLDRGYERLELKLQALGASIRREKDSTDLKTPHTSSKVAHAS